MNGMFTKKKKSDSDMALQITSMADIFTLILVFLLKSSASGESSVTPTTNMQLPVGKGNDIVHEVLKMEINSDSILVDQKVIHQLNNFAYPVTDVQASGASQALYQALLEQRKFRKDPNFSSELLILADDQTPYSTLKVALASAGMSGFVNLDLVLVEDE